MNSSVSLLPVFEEQKTKVQTNTSRHVLMSRMMSADEFRRHMLNHSLATEVMLEPQEEWFEDNNYNYPVGIFDWVEKNVHDSVTIYSSIFHHPNRGENHLDRLSGKSASVGFMSSIMIDVVFEYVSRPTVRVEMTVGNDKVMLITKDSLILKSKYGNDVFETWRRESDGGKSFWSKSRVRNTNPFDSVYSYPPVLLGKYSANIIALLGFLVPKCMDPSRNCEFVTHQMHLKLENDHTLKLNPDIKTPPELQDLYCSIVRQIKNFHKDNNGFEETMCFVEKTFEEFRLTLSKYVTKNPTVLVKPTV